MEIKEDRRKTCKTGICADDDKIVKASSAAKRSDIYEFLYIKNWYQHDLIKELILVQKDRSMSETMPNSQHTVSGLVNFCQPQQNTSIGRIQAVIPN